MNMLKFLLLVLFPMYISCVPEKMDMGNEADDNDTVISGDDLLEGGDVDMTGWPDYTRPEMSSSGPSVVTYSQNKSLVNGKPFLPIGIYAVNQADMPAVAEYGFNLVQSYQVSLDWTEAQMMDWLDTAQENGLMTFVNLDGASLDDVKIDKIKKFVKAYKDHPSVYAWYLADEPQIAVLDPADLAALYEWIKNKDKNHPVFTSNWELQNFSEACDVDMRQLYDGIPSFLTPDLTRYLNANAQYIRTWVAIINSHDINWEKDGDELNPANMYNGLTEGTPEWEKAEEQAQYVSDHKEDPEAAGLKFSSGYPKTPVLLRSSLYWPMVHGSNGFYYWLYQNPDILNIRWGWYTIFHKPDLNAAIPGVLDEFSQLSKFLVNPGISSISFNQGDIYVWSKIVDNRRIIIAINESTNGFEGEIDLSELYITGRTLAVYMEDGREIPLADDIFCDTFRPNEVHVYFVK